MPSPCTWPRSITMPSSPGSAGWGTPWARPATATPPTRAPRIGPLAASFVARIGSRDPVVIGVGGPAPSLPGLARARTEAERTVRVLRDTSPCGRAARLDDVYLEAVLDRLGEVLDDDNGSYGPIARLISYDAENG